MNLLFDFDGTLVDSFYCLVEIARQLADEFQFRKIEEQEIEELRNLSSRQVLQFLKIPLIKVPLLITRVRKCLHDKIKSLAPVPQMGLVLEQLASSHTLGILTSNSKENVSLWLEYNQWQHFFKFIHTENHYLSKKYLLRKTLARYQMKQSDTFYIGDETRDIEAAQKNHLQAIAVSWGYHSEKVLLTSKPTYLVHKPEELLALLS